MATNTTDPMTYVPGGKAVDREWYPNQGPVTGLSWGAEMVRQDCLAWASNYDELKETYADNLFGRGLCQGHAEACREVAAALIQYAWWKE